MDVWQWEVSTMSTTISFKQGYHNNDWHGRNPPAMFGTNYGYTGFETCVDMRNDTSRDPFVYLISSSTVFMGGGGGFGRYNPIHDTWDYLQANGTFPATTPNPGTRNGSFLIHAPSRGPRGTISAQGTCTYTGPTITTNNGGTTVVTNGATVTQITLSTALPQTVAANQLANRGDGVGYKIRIISNSAASSGYVQEAYIIANSSGTTPILTLSSQFAQTIQSGDAYEFLSGRIYAICSSAANTRYYDIATGYIGTPSSTSAPALSTDACGLMLDEGYTPNTLAPGQGFLGTLIATASAAGTITGQASGGDAGVLANEYRNFQIRIVQDTGTPTSVGQRRKITSHTAGASPVYTLASNWTVNPSSTASFVIEYANELLVMQGGSANNYTYTIDANGQGTADTWSTSTYGARPNAGVAGMQLTGCWGMQNSYDGSGAKAAHVSYFYFFRGAGITIDMLDIAGGSTGAWTTALQADHNRAANANLISTCARLQYDPATLGGRYAYIVCAQGNDYASPNVSSPTRFILKFDLLTRQIIGEIGCNGIFYGTTFTAPLYWSLFYDAASSLKIGSLGIFGLPYSVTNAYPPFQHMVMELFV